MNEKYKFPIFIGINGRMENCSSGLLGVIVRNTFHFIPVVPLLALKIRKDLSEIASWLGPTKKGMGLFGHFRGLAPFVRSFPSHFFFSILGPYVPGALRLAYPIVPRKT